MNANRKCLECDEILQGRADKKFCDDQCRSNYNNKTNNQGIVAMRNINSILRKNYKILDSVITQDGKLKIPKIKLHDKGFNFRYHTHTYKTQKGNIYKLCYDYAYLSLDNGLVMVMKWKAE